MKERTGIPDKPHMFFRMIDGKENFYIVNIYGDYEDLVHNAAANPGTLKIVDAVSGKTVWQPS